MRKRFKIPLIGLITIAVLAIGALVVLYKSHFLESLANRYLADKIASRYNLDINISEIEGSFLAGFILKDVTLRFTPEGEAVTLAYLPRIAVSYDLGDVWRGRLRIDSLYFQQPVFYLRKTKSGEWVLPRISTGKGEAWQAPTWEVRKLAIDSAYIELDLAGEKWIWEGVDLRASARSEDNTHAVDLDHLDFRLDKNQTEVRHVSGEATIFEKNLAVDNAVLTTDSSNLRFSLVYNGSEGGRAEIRLDTSRIHLPDFVSFLGLDLNGDIDLEGSVYNQAGRTGGSLFLSGTFEERSFDSLHTRFHYDAGVFYADSVHGRILGNCLVHGFGEIDLGSHPEGYRLTAHVDSFNLDRLVFDSFESDLNGRLCVNGRGLSSGTMAIDLDLELSESYFDIYHFHQADGVMTVTRNGLYFFPGFQVSYYDNRFYCSGNINYDGELFLEGSAVLNDLTSFTGQTFIKEPAGRAEGEFIFYGPTTDPNLSGRFRSDSLWLYEFYSSDFTSGFDIRGFLTKMQGPVTVESRNGEGWAFPYDSLWAIMKLDSNLLYIDSGKIDNQFSTTKLRGLLDFVAYPQKMTVDNIEIELAGRSFIGDGDQIIYVDSSGFIFDRVVLDASDGSLSFAGRFDYDESIDITWDVKNISVEPWATLISDTLRIDGRLSSVGYLGGTLPDPAFEVKAYIDSLYYYSLNLGNLSAYASYRDSLLQIDSASLESPNGMYTASGTMPINLNLYFEGDLFDDRRQNIYIYARDRRLDLFSFILESVEYITGEFEATVVLTGSPLRPHLNGASVLHNGSIKLIDLRDRLENVQIDIEMTDQLIKVLGMTAAVPYNNGNKRGSITAGGTIFVNDISNFTYDIDLKCSGLPVRYELGDFNALADADLEVKGSTPPRVSGDIVLHQAYYRENFYSGEAGFNLMAALEADKSWSLDLMVECPSNSWVKNDDIDGEFSGSVNIIRDLGTYNFLGTLEVIRGKLFFLDRIFQIEPGGQIIYDNIEEPDPKLDLTISTRVRSYARFSDFESEESYSYELVLHVGGTLNNPIITGTGDSPISTEEILPTLFTGMQPIESDTVESGSVGTDRITHGLSGILAGQFSRLGTRTLGVETFELSPAAGKTFDPLATRLTIGAYTLPNLYIFGSSAFDVERGQEVGLEYRLGRHYLFEGRRDENNLYHFNFKFHWEY